MQVQHKIKCPKDVSHTILRWGKYVAMFQIHFIFTKGSYVRVSPAILLGGQTSIAVISFLAAPSETLVSPALTVIFLDLPAIRVYVHTYI